MPQQPSLGRVVHVLVHPTTNNNSDVAPATVTRVWDKHSDGSWSVNLRVTLDASTGSKWLPSARLFDTEAEAREHDGTAAFWPPRV